MRILKKNTKVGLGLFLLLSLIYFTGIYSEVTSCNETGWTQMCGIGPGLMGVIFSLGLVIPIYNSLEYLGVINESNATYLVRIIISILSIFISSILLSKIISFVFKILFKIRSR